MEMSYWQLILHAHIVVQLVLLILVIGSLWSWAIIIRRHSVLKMAHKEAIAFEKQFWSGGNLGQLYQSLIANKSKLTGSASLFVAGFAEFIKLHRTANLKGDVVIDGVERVTRVAMMEETAELEKNISLLGTIGAIAPYVGLLGTVWGIMGSFTALSGVEQATLAMVAPHIAEALIATALGLIVAIPAVVGYNRLSRQLDGILLKYENIQDDLCVLLYREAYRGEQGAQA